MSTLLIIRHGDTHYNSDGSGKGGKVRGWLPVGLSEEGEADARQIAKKLVGKGLKGLVSSDLKRCKQTTIIIANELDIEPVYTDKLRTWNVGDFTGQDQETAQPKIARYVRRPDDVIPGGESFNQFKERIFAGLAEALALYPEGLAVVTHNYPMCLIEAWKAAGMSPDHEIDAETFIEHEEECGSIETLHTTMAALTGQDEPAPEPEPSELEPEEPEPEEYGDAIGLAENPASVRFHCGECEYFSDGTCHFDDPRLNGRKVEPEWCCNKFDHTGMRVIVQ